MGGSRWDPGDWDTYATASVRGKSSAEIFTSRHLKDEYDPAKIDFRESCDSEENPNSTPIILASDVTGSMGMIAHHLMTEGLNTLITEIYDRAPVVDPHVMVLAIGDTTCDSAPLQATQFEADICLADQVRELWVEGGGGGNFGESYSGAHLFAAMKTRTDSIRKRNKKGFLFTIGDEPNNDGMTAEEAQRIGMPLEADVTAAQAVALAQRDWEVYHVVLTNVGRCMYNKDGGDGQLARDPPRADHPPAGRQRPRRDRRVDLAGSRRGRRQDGHGVVVGGTPP